MSFIQSVVRTANGFGFELNNEDFVYENDTKLDEVLREIVPPTQTLEVMKLFRRGEIGVEDMTRERIGIFVRDAFDDYTYVILDDAQAIQLAKLLLGAVK